MLVEVGFTATSNPWSLQAPPKAGKPLNMEAVNGYIQGGLNQ